MKFAVFCFIVCVIAQAYATMTVPIAPIPAEADYARVKKSAYGGGASYAAPPCPKNYLVSCAPNVQPVGCAQQSYGSSGAYSQYMPVYAAPPAPQGFRQFTY